MKKFLLLSCLAIMFLGQQTTKAQWIYDSISMGPGANDDIFYKMNAEGAAHTSSNLGWHLAFTQFGLGDSAAIWANHNSGNGYTEVYDINKPAGDWSTVVLGDTLNATKLYNGVEAWNQGALNDIASPNPFDFGWGIYDPVAHYLTGARIFIVKGDGVFYKVLVESLDPSATVHEWTVKVGLFDVMNTTYTYPIMKSPTFDERHFAYLNLATGQVLDREPNIAEWDIVFTKFTDLVVAGPPPTPAQPYNVVGILSNRAVQTTQASMIDVDDAELDYFTTYQSNLALQPISEVGWDWKQFNNVTFEYDIVDSNSYFIKGQFGNTWQVEFLGYGGLGNGDVTFRKRKIEFPLAVNDISSKSKIAVYPNPTSDIANIIFDSETIQNISCSIYSMNGAMVSSFEKKANKGLNVWQLPTAHFPTGNYVINILSGNDLATQKMTILR